MPHRLAQLLRILSGFCRYTPLLEGILSYFTKIFAKIFLLKLTATYVSVLNRLTIHLKIHCLFYQNSKH